jgi:hypothetical protein
MEGEGNKDYKRRIVIVPVMPKWIAKGNEGE